MVPKKTSREKALFIKWYPIFMKYDRFTEQQIKEFKHDTRTKRN